MKDDSLMIAAYNETKFQQYWLHFYANNFLDHAEMFCAHGESSTFIFIQ